MLTIQFNTYTPWCCGTVSPTCAELKCQCLEGKAHRESVTLQETGIHLGMSISSEFLTKDSNENKLRIFLAFCFFQWLQYSRAENTVGILNPCTSTLKKGKEI